MFLGDGLQIPRVVLNRLQVPVEIAVHSSQTISSQIGNLGAMRIERIQPFAVQAEAMQGCCEGD